MTDDTISRQAAIDAVDSWLYESTNKRTPSEVLKAVPSAQPEQRWTPVSEKQPEETGTYMTTIDYGEYGLVTGQRYYHGGVLGWNDECVIAWMPLPEPWKGEDND